MSRSAGGPNGRPYILLRVICTFGEQGWLLRNGVAHVGGNYYFC